jgi:hypothetical protein
MKGRIVGIGVLLTLAGCSMSATDKKSSEAPTNQCSDSRECAGGRCVNHTCVAAAGVISSLMFKIEGPGTATLSQFAGKTLLTSVADLPLGGGALDLSVPGLCEVNGTITLPASRIQKLAANPPSCKFDFTTSPLTITFVPRVTWSGLSVSPTQTTADALTCPCPSGAACDPCEPKFSVTLPAGDYDVYVQQKLDVQQELADDPTEVDPACQIIPSALPVTVEEGQTDLTLALPEPKTLTLGVRWPSDDASVLNGWVVDMLDPATGRRLSAEVVLASRFAQLDASSSAYVTALDYVEDAAHDGNETVRLAPPSGVVAPTVLVSRQALELFPDRSVFSQLVLPTKVTVSGSLVDGRPGGGPVPGTVTFVATAIDGIQPGTTASFQRSVSIDASAGGLFDVVLLPGQYRVHALPADRCPGVPCPGGAPSCECPLGASDPSWVVAKSPSFQGGKSVPLAARTDVVGHALTPLGDGANGSAARLDPELLPATPIETALGEAAVTPRTATSSVDPSGHFGLVADTAAYQFTLRPASSTGFPWFVRPDLVVDGSQAGSDLDLGTVSLPLPVRYSGHVTVAGEATVLPNVLIRAYAFLGDKGVSSGPDDPVNPARSVIQVAETTADSSGQFDLWLPSQIDCGSP